MDLFVNYTLHIPLTTTFYLYCVFEHDSMQAGFVLQIQIVNSLYPNDNRPEQFDAKSYSKQLFFRNFCSEMSFFSQKTQKTENEHFFGPTVALRNFFSAF